jgi:hypothetical protein
LKVAMQAFTNLQHIQLLRLQDHHDASLISYIRDHNDHLVELKWSPGM